MGCGAATLFGLLVFASAGQAAAPDEIHVTVTMGDFWFSPGVIATEVNTTLNITVVNSGGQRHEFEVLGYGVETAADPGQNGSLVFLADRTGLFTIICGVAGHSTSGMVGRLIVVGPGFELNPVAQVASQIIGLVEAVEEEYEEANVTNHVIQNEGEYNEAKDFAATAKSLWVTIRDDAAARDDSGAAKVSAALDELALLINQTGDYTLIETEVDEIIAELTEIGGAAPGTPGGTWQSHLADLRAGLNATVAQYKAGDPTGADTRLGELYLAHVEPLEDALQPVDPALKGRMETEIIVELRGLMRSGASSSAVDAKLVEVQATLAQVESTLGASGHPQTVTIVQKELDVALAGTLGIAIAALGAIATMLAVRVSRLNRQAASGGHEPAKEPLDKGA